MFKVTEHLQAFSNGISRSVQQQLTRFQVTWGVALLGTEVDLGPGDIVLDGGSAAPTERATAAPPHFPVHFVLARLHISAIAEFLLFNNFMIVHKPDVTLGHVQDTARSRPITDADHITWFVAQSPLIGRHLAVVHRRPSITFSNRRVT